MREKKAEKKILKPSSFPLILFFNVSNNANSNQALSSIVGVVVQKKNVVESTRGITHLIHC